MKTLQVESIRVDGGTQSRTKLDTGHVDELAEILSEGGTLPPVEVIHDGTDYWLYDGFHRHFAHQKAGLGTIPAIVKKGTQRDAVLAACGANATHGLKRTNTDKRKAVETLLKDAEWVQKSDRWVADQCKVSHPFVAGIRGDLQPESDSTGNITSSTTRTGKDGKGRKKSSAARSASGKAKGKSKGKISGGTSFNVDEIEAAPSNGASSGTSLEKALDFIAKATRQVDAAHVAMPDEKMHDRAIECLGSAHTALLAWRTK